MSLSIRTSTKWLLAVVGAAMTWLMLAGTVLAAGHAQTESDPESNLPYLFGVYTVTWLGFFAYAFYVSRRQRELRREIEDLRRELQQKSS